MIIHKSFSKLELTEIIEDLSLSITFTRNDSKLILQEKLINYIKNNKIDIISNYYKIKNQEELILFLTNSNPKKTLSIKQKNDVMLIARNIINYTKVNYQIENSTYNNLKDLIDDLDYIKQFGDIPSVRRACRLMNLDNNFMANRFIPLISEKEKLKLDKKKLLKEKYTPYISIRHSTKKSPIILYFD